MNQYCYLKKIALNLNENRNENILEIHLLSELYHKLNDCQYQIFQKLS